MVEGQPQSRAATVPLMAVPFDVDRAPDIGQGSLAVYGDGRLYLTGLYGRARLALSAASDVTHRGFDFGIAQTTFRRRVDPNRSRSRRPLRPSDRREWCASR
jgi:hypothetical protein